MYNDFFGFHESPFTVTPDPRIFYATPLYQRVYANLLSGICQRQGVIVLTGEAGTGKTTILRRLMTNLKHSVRFAFCPYSTLSFDDLLDFICDDFELPQKPQGRSFQLQALYKFLLSQQQQNQHAALLIDEAHHLQPSVLAALAELASYTVGNEVLLPIALVGQLELEERLHDPVATVLRDRIALSCQLDRLQKNDVGPFIFHRLNAVGYRRSDLFPPEVIAAIAEYSQGIPRYINTICDNALLIARIEMKKIVTPAIIEEVAQDLQLLPSAVLPDEHDAASDFGEPVVPVDISQHVETVVPVDVLPQRSSPAIPAVVARTSVRRGYPWQPLVRSFASFLVSTWVGLGAAGVLCFLLFFQSPLPETTEVVARNGPPPESDEVKSTPPPPPTSAPTAQPPVPSVKSSSAQHVSSPSAKPNRIVRPDVTGQHTQQQPVRPPTESSTQAKVSPAKPPVREITIATAFSNPLPVEREAKKKSAEPQRDPFAMAKPPLVAPARLLPPKDNSSREGTLQRHPAPREEKGLTPLMTAVMQGRTTTVQALLKKGVEVNTQNTAGRTALMLAALKGRTDILQALIKRGAVVNAKNDEGWTALMYAAWNGHTKTVQTLLRSGAKVDTKSTTGGTALTHAVRNGHHDVARILRSGETGASAQPLSMKSTETRATRSTDFRSLTLSKRPVR
ncbi:MAG: hypothetical protein FJ147_26950 [Deltaproteobacteria bacterium]|nr:hypothetical protein [Deltaproteobacteria bacterium]